MDAVFSKAVAVYFVIVVVSKVSVVSYTVDSGAFIYNDDFMVVEYFKYFHVAQ